MKGAPQNPRVGIASVGLGRIQRGYERHSSGLFAALQPICDVTLYRSAGGSGSQERVSKGLGPLMKAMRVLPFEGVAGVPEYRAYKSDSLAFALTLLPDLLRNRVDVVQVVDYPLAIALAKLKRMFRFRTKIIFTDGGLMPPQYYPWVDHIHHVGKAHFDTALAFGIPAERMRLVPSGLSCREFSTAVNRCELRKKYGVACSTFVILAVTAINRVHKRVDHLITEVAQIQGDVLLWIDGRAEDRALLEEAQQKLGKRLRITHLPSNEVRDLYHLADVFVHAALEEGFGLAICEAAASGLMVLSHDSPHFEWLLEERACLVDMSLRGPLSCRLQELANSPRPAHRAPDLARKMRSRFDWEVLAPAYLDMYRYVVTGESAGNSVSA